MRVWDEDGTLSAVLRGHAHRVGVVEVWPSGDLLLTGGWDAAVRSWDLVVLGTDPESRVIDFRARYGRAQ